MYGSMEAQNVLPKVASLAEGKESKIKEAAEKNEHPSQNHKSPRSDVASYTEPEIR